MSCGNLFLLTLDPPLSKFAKFANDDLNPNHLPMSGFGQISVTTNPTPKVTAEAVAQD